MVANFAFSGATSLNDCSNKVTKSVCEVFCFSFANLIVFTKSESLAPLPAKDVIMLGIDTSSITFIPPFKSKPKFNSNSLHSL